MVVNNWHVIAQIYVNITGHRFVLWYFIVFYICSVMIMLNIIVAFVIDMYSSVDTLNKTKGEVIQRKSEV